MFDFLSASRRSAFDWKAFLLCVVNSFIINFSQSTCVYQNREYCHIYDSCSKDNMWQWYILVLKIRKSKICRGVDRQSTLKWLPLFKAIAYGVDPGGGVDKQLTQRGSTINFRVKRLSPLLILGTDRQSTHRGSTVNFQVKRWSSLLILWGGSMIAMERINSQLSLLHGKVIVSVDPGGSTSPETFHA